MQLRAFGRRAVFGFAGLGMLALGTMGSASAVTSYQGDDYSYDYSSGNGMASCDMESDKTPVKGVYDRDYSGGTDGSVKDSDGNNGVCGSNGTSVTVFRHKTCEYRSAWPDTCGNWQTR